MELTESRSLFLLPLVITAFNKLPKFRSKFPLGASNEVIEIVRFYRCRIYKFSGHDALQNALRALEYNGSVEV